MFDLIIIGGGPAGMTAAVYAARKKLETLIITIEYGGQVMWTQDIENYMGFQIISGYELINKFEEQIKDYMLKDQLKKVVNIEKKENHFIVYLEQDEVFKAKTLIIASGKQPRLLNVPGEKKFTGRGVSYCTTCDGPLYMGQDIAVIGGGNSALQTAYEMSEIANKIYLISNEDLTADPIAIDKVKSLSNVEILINFSTKEIMGDQFVESIRIKSMVEEISKELSVNGVFVEIGLIPNSEFARHLVAMNDLNEIIVNCKCETNITGIFAAGDVTTVPEKQIIIAAGEGAKASIAAYEYLLHQKI